MNRKQQYDPELEAAGAELHRALLDQRDATQLLKSAEGRVEVHDMPMR